MVKSGRYPNLQERLVLCWAAVPGYLQGEGPRFLASVQGGGDPTTKALSLEFPSNLRGSPTLSNIFCKDITNYPGICSRKADAWILFFQGTIFFSRTNWEQGCAP